MDKRKEDRSLMAEYVARQPATRKKNGGNKKERKKNGGKKNGGNGGNGENSQPGPEPSENVSTDKPSADNPSISTRSQSQTPKSKADTPKPTPKSRGFQNKNLIERSPMEGVKVKRM